MTDIRELITRLRSERGLTQAELAQAAGVSQPTLSRIEAGVMPNLDTLEKILAALGYRVVITMGEEACSTN